MTLQSEPPNIVGSEIIKNEKNKENNLDLQNKFDCEGKHRHDSSHICTGQNDRFRRILILILNSDIFALDKMTHSDVS